MDYSGNLSGTLVYMETTTSTIGFTGTDDVDVGAFLFTHDNAIMRGKNENDKAACIFAYLAGETHSS